MMTNILAERIWFNTKQAAEYAGCHPTTVRHALQAGELAGTQRKESGRWRIHRDWLDSWCRGEAA